MHKHTRTCTHTRAHTHAHTHTHTHTHMHTYIYTRTCTHTHTYTHTCTHIYTHTQYENETWLFGNWEVNSVIRPHWSDREGKIEHPDKKLWSPPPGWQWEGDQWLNRREPRSVGSRMRKNLKSLVWYLSSYECQFTDPLFSVLDTCCSLVAYDPDEGLDEVQEKVFENQTRLPRDLLHWPSEKDQSRTYWSNIVSWGCREVSRHPPQGSLKKCGVSWGGFEVTFRPLPSVLLFS